MDSAPKTLLTGEGDDVQSVSIFASVAACAQCTLCSCEAIGNPSLVVSMPVPAAAADHSNTDAKAVAW